MGFKRGMGEVKSGLSQTAKEIAKLDADFQRKMGGDFIRTLQNGGRSVRELGTDFLQTASAAGLSGTQIEAAAGSMGIFSRGQLSAAKGSADLAIETDRLIHQMKNGEITAAQAGEEFGKLAANAQSSGININQAAAKFAVAAAVIGTAIVAIKAGFDFAREGAELDYASVKFERMAGSVGSLSNVMLGDLREATRGLYSDAELMARAGDFMALGLAKTHDEAVRLATVAGALNMNMNQLVLTLTNQTTMRFDTLGVTVDGFKEKVAALEAAGMSANDAFNEAFLQQAEEQILKVGHAADTTLGAFMRLEAQSANTWDRLKTAAGKALEPIANSLADSMEQSNLVSAAFDQLAVSMYQVYQEGQGMVWMYQLTNGELVTAEQLVILYERALRGNNFELERAAMLHGMLWPEIESTSSAALSAADAMDRLKSVNTNLSGTIESQLEKARLWAAGIDDVDASVSNLVARFMNGEISVLQFEKGMHDLQVAATLTAVAAKTIGDEEAQKQLQSYGLGLEQIKSLLEGIASGEYNAELIIDLITVGGFSLDAATQIANDNGRGWQNAQNAARSAGRKGHADGGRLGSKGPLVKVGEQGWEYAQYDPSTGAWEIIPHNKSVQMERDRALGMAGGGRLLDGNQYVTQPGNSSAYGTVGNIAPSAVARAAGGGSVARAAGGGQNSQVRVQQAAEAAAVAALAATGAASTAAAGVAQEINLQAMEAFTKEIQSSNARVEGLLSRIARDQLTRADMREAVKQAVAELV